MLQDRADYIALNLSCPNSAADRDFFDELPRIDALLQRLAQEDPRVPLILKLKPTRDAGVLREIVAIADGHPFVSGFAINLPSGKPDFLKVTVARDSLEKLPGAVGGPPVEDFVNAILGTLKSITQDRYALIAAGGVTTAEAAYTKLKLGATAVQLYTGLVYHGPTLNKQILTGLLELMDRDGVTDVRALGEWGSVAGAKWVLSDQTLKVGERPATTSGGKSSVPSLLESPCVPRACPSSPSACCSQRWARRASPPQRHPSAPRPPVPTSARPGRSRSSAPAARRSRPRPRAPASARRCG